MPSLRRSFSSLSVRSSPYPSSLSPAAPSSTRPRQSPLHPRRASASATAERRVLADIEWWRVHDGQCDLDPHEPPQLLAHPPLDTDISSGAMVTLSVTDHSLDPPLLYTFTLDATQPVLPDPLAALSIAPHSPLATPHGRNSAESTPELPTTELESGPFGDHFPLVPSSLTQLGGRPVHPLFGFRSISAPARSHRGLEPDFADVGGDSFSLDQNLFQ